MKFIVMLPEPCSECRGPIAVPEDVEVLHRGWACLTEHPNSVQRCHSDECSRGGER